MRGKGAEKSPVTWKFPSLHCCVFSEGDVDWEQADVRERPLLGGPVLISTPMAWLQGIRIMPNDGFGYILPGKSGTKSWSGRQAGKSAWPPLPPAKTSSSCRHCGLFAPTDLRQMSDADRAWACPCHPCITAGETVERIVSYQPPIPGPQTLTITARTVAGRTFTLPATAVGIQPGLTLSHNKVGMHTSFAWAGLLEVQGCSQMKGQVCACMRACFMGQPR